MPDRSFRKKPVVIQAFKLGHDSIPDWFMDRVTLNDVILHLDRGDPGNHADINTLEGTMRADAGDYVIKGVKGELYPCKPDIFEATYEEIEPPRPGE
jgi:hypothetical protein